MLKIHKYASNTNTNTHGKTRNTQIQKYRHTQIQILPLALLARSKEEENEIYHHLSSQENRRNFSSRNKKKAPNVANRRHLTGDKTPLQDGVSQKIF